MIRTLLALAALIAVALAVIQGDPVLIVAASIFALVVLILMIGSFSRKRRQARKPYTAPAASTEKTPDRELKELGILEIRPRTPSRPLVPPAVQEPVTPEPVPTSAEAPPMPEPAAIEEAPPVSEPPPRTVTRMRPRSFRSDEERTPEEAAREVTEHLLHALLLGTGAHTVCLLRQEEAPSLKYHIEGCVSHNAYARPNGTFSAKRPLVLPGERGAVLHRVSEDDLRPSALRYYREELAVRQVIAVAFRAGGEPYVLLADSMQEGILETPRVRRMMEETARLAAINRDAHAASPEEVPAEAPPTARPRREIIAEEMARAGEGRMAFALVHLMQEGLEGDEALADAERTFESELRARTPSGRVERFGELTYGVFLHHEVTEVEAWASEAHQQLSGHYGPEAQVSIGVALLDSRHESPQSLRDDAEFALERAYAQGGDPVILE